MPGLKKKKPNEKLNLNLKPKAEKNYQKAGTTEGVRARNQVEKN
jgi:hypothetical protein